MDSGDALRQLAIEVRAFLAPHWREWHAKWGPPNPQTPSQWTCSRSAAFLAFALEQAGSPAWVASGRPGIDLQAPPSGFFAGDHWEDHAWVVCGDRIIDITADQFGEAEVVIADLSDARYRAGQDAETTLPLTTRGSLAVEELKGLWS
jgi:hypothetical protein